MNKKITGTAAFLLLSFQAYAAEPITKDQIQQVVDMTDVATMNHDTAGIGKYLSETFERVIQFIHKEKYLAKVRVNKEKYLHLIDEGWLTLEEYDYQRENTEIQIMADGASGQSYSTITETLSLDGTKMVSKFREHALYALENGKPVITQISGHTLVGDTMRKPGQ